MIGTLVAGRENAVEIGNEQDVKSIDLQISALKWVLGADK